MRFLSVLAPRIEQLLALVIDPSYFLQTSYIQERREDISRALTRAPLFHLQQVKAKFLQ